MPAISRLIYVRPACGELFYMHMLLTHQVGCTSFHAIRTVGDVVFPTYRAACERLGLLGDDQEWDNTFAEASTWENSSELRTLFTHMLLYCDISNQLDFWNKHWRAMEDDISPDIRHVLGITSTPVNNEDLQQYILYEIQLVLNSSSSNPSLSDYGLPTPCAALLATLRNRLLLEEKNYDRVELRKAHDGMLQALNGKQRQIHDQVLSSCNADMQILLFNGHGGTGKTFLCTAIISALRSSGKVVLAVAGSGISSLLLPAGRTARSRFKIPLEVTDDSLCFIKKNTQLAQLLLGTSPIIWDEAPMSCRRCFESLDRTLRDILEMPDVPFGGKSVLLGGDFRQTLLVKSKALKSEIISSSLPKSPLWPLFNVVKLIENMRLSGSNLTGPKKEAAIFFSEWLLSIGDGKGVVNFDSLPDCKIIEVPEQYLI